MWVAAKHDTGTAGVNIYLMGGNDKGYLFVTGGAPRRMRFIPINNPGGAIVGQLIRDGALGAGDAAATEADFVEKGATASYGAVTSFSQYWQDWSELTSFP